MNIETLLSDRTHLKRCEGLKQIAKLGTGGQSYEGLVVLSLEDSMPIVVKNALKTLLVIGALSDSALKKVFVCFGRYIGERGCSYSCCGWNALTHSEVVEAAGELILKLSADDNGERMLGLLRSAVSSDALPAASAAEIVAFLAHEQGPHWTKRAAAMGVNTASVSVFFTE